MRILQETEHGAEQHQQEEEEEEVEENQIDDDSIDEAPPPPAAADDDESPHVASVSAEVVVRRPRHMRRKGRYNPNFLAAGETAPSTAGTTAAGVSPPGRCGDAAAEEETRTTDRASATAIVVAATVVTAVAVAATGRVQLPEAVTAGRDLVTAEYALQRGTLRAARAVRVVAQIKVARAEVAQRIAERQVAVLEANLVDIQLENSERLSVLQMGTVK